MNQRDPISQRSGVRVGIFHSGRISPEKCSPAPDRALALSPGEETPVPPGPAGAEGHERDQHAAGPRSPPKARAALLGFFLFHCLFN